MLQGFLLFCVIIPSGYHALLVGHHNLKLALLCRFQIYSVFQLEDVENPALVSLPFLTIVNRTPNFIFPPCIDNLDISVDIYFCYICRYVFLLNSSELAYTLDPKFFFFGIHSLYNASILI